MTAFRDRIAALGAAMTPAMIAETQAMCAAGFPGVDPATTVTRDHAYGPDPRHRLDLFRQDGTASAPVLVFVHGGGFVMGDKRHETLPFYDNIGDWAARQGWLGVTMTYRLAPAHRFPSGVEDLALAIGWLRETVAAHGGDPARILLVGQSAGAAHVASYVAHGGGEGLAGAAMVSGIYDIAASEVNAFHEAYYGADQGQWAAASSTDGLIASALPLMFTLSEFDVPDFHKQAALLTAAWFAAKGTYPPLAWLAGHNHLSPALSIGGGESQLESELAAFVARATG